MAATPTDKAKYRRLRHAGFSHKEAVAMSAAVPSGDLGGPQAGQRLGLSHNDEVTLLGTSKVDFDLVADLSPGTAVPEGWSWDDTEKRLVVPAGLYAASITVELSQPLGGTAIAWAGLKFSGKPNIDSSASSVTALADVIHSSLTDWVTAENPYIAPRAGSTQATHGAYCNFVVVRIA